MAKKAVEETEKFGQKAAPKVDQAVHKTEEALNILADKVQSGEIVDDVKKVAQQTGEALEKIARQTGKVLQDAGKKASPHLKEAKEKIVEKTKPIIDKLKEKKENL